MQQRDVIDPIGTEFRPGYTCTQCADVRSYGGQAKPEDPLYTPLLQCGVCGLATRHQFNGMMEFKVDVVQRAPGDRYLVVRHVLVNLPPAPAETQGEAVQA